MATTITKRSDQMRKLRLQCTDGESHDVSFDVAMMSPRLWHIVQEITTEFTETQAVPNVIGVCIGDLPSNGVKHALEYCRCLYERQVHGNKEQLQKWEEDFADFDSRLLCEIASAAYHFDIQPLVDITCRSIAQIMSESGTAHDIRDTFGLEDEDDDCSCVVTELRATLAGLDVDILDHLNCHSDDDNDFEDEHEHELAQKLEVTDHRSVDDLMNFINGSTATIKDAMTCNKSKKNSKRKKRKSKKKKASKTEITGPVAVDEEEAPSEKTAVDDLSEKLQLATVDPSAIFDESKFEDDDVDAEVESFRRALEDAHKQSSADKKKVALRIPFSRAESQP